MSMHRRDRASRCACKPGQGLDEWSDFGQPWGCGNGAKTAIKLDPGCWTKTLECQAMSTHVNPKTQDCADASPRKTAGVESSDWDPFLNSGGFRKLLDPFCCHFSTEIQQNPDISTPHLSARNFVALWEVHHGGWGIGHQEAGAWKNHDIWSCGRKKCEFLYWDLRKF